MIDLSKLPPPDIIESLDYESLYQEILADFAVLMGDNFTAYLESDPVIKVLEAFAYREMLLRARVNDAARAVCLAWAVGDDLTNLAADFDMQRLLITPENLSTVPPTPAVYENDERFRIRRQLAPELLTSVGTYGEYLARVLESSALIYDARIVGPKLQYIDGIPTTFNEVPVGYVYGYVLSNENNTHIPSAELINTIQAHIDNSEIAKFGELFLALPGEIVEYEISAELTIFPGPAGEAVQAAALADVTTLTNDLFKLGYDINRAIITAALNVPGVQNIALALPAADIVIAENQAGKCAAINITINPTPHV